VGLVAARLRNDKRWIDMRITCNDRRAGVKVWKAWSGVN
jgi:hypothetical protein